MEVERIWAEGQRLYGEGKLREAAQLFDQMHRLNPAHPFPLYMLGLIAGQQGRNHEALDLLGHAAAAAPGHPVIQADFANALRLSGQVDRAMVVLNQVLAQEPAFVTALERRGFIYWSRGRHAEALADFQLALTRAPRRPDLLFHAGTLLDELGRTPDALAAYDRAVAIDLNHFDARNSRGWARLQLGQFDGALADFQQVTRSRPGFAGGQFNLALYWLLMGDFERGLPLYEYRLQHAGVATLFPAPRWSGAESLEGKTVLVHGEGGLGDVIQFCRLLPPLAKRGAQILLACSPRLRRLLAPLPVTVVERLSAPPDHQLHLMSLPLACGLRADTIPPPPPLAAEPALVARWRERLGGNGFRIGIVWHGEYGSGSRDKCFPLAALAPLAKLDGVRLISLQKGESTPELDRLPDGMKLEVFEELDSGPDAFVDTAAIMANLDLVISADSSPAHLAGALGVRVWTLLKYVPDWRWQLHRPDTPWYPGMRLIRQSRPGDWDGVIAEVTAGLEILLGERRR